MRLPETTSSISTRQDFFCDLEGEGADTAVEAVDQGNFSKLKARMEALCLRRLIGAGGGGVGRNIVWTHGQS